MEDKNWSKLQIIFQNLIKAERKIKDISQMEMAIRTGFSQSAISKYESGERKLDIVELASVCDALDIKLSDFILKLEKKIEENNAPR
jgi:transcriptional regulator with XRE-family HTH domain